MTIATRYGMSRDPSFRRKVKSRRRPAVESLESRQLLTSGQQFPVLPPGTFVGQMAAGPGGDVWFLKQTKSTGDFSLELTSTLARIGPDGRISDYPLPGPGGYPNGPQAFATGPDGSLYLLTESLVDYQPVFGIDRIAPDGSLAQLTLTRPILTGEFLKDPEAGPNLDQVRPIYTSLYLTVGGDGNLWVSSGIASAGGIAPFRLIDRIMPDGIVTEFNTGRYSQGPLAVAADGSVWFATVGQDPGPTFGQSELARLSHDGTVTDFFLGGQVAVPSVVSGADGNIWFSETFANSSASPEIGRITPGGLIATFPLTNPGGSIGQLTTGPDGNIWFTESVNYSADPVQPHAYKVGEIDGSGMITETTVSPSTNAFVDVDAGSITTGPNGQIWYAENSYQAGHSQIGELLLEHGSLTVVGLKPPVTRGKATEIVLAFSEALVPFTARSLANYRLVTLARPGVPLPRHDQPIRLGSAVYDAKRHTVTLTVRGRLNPSLVYQVTVNGLTPRGVAAFDHIHLSGNGSGKPGSDFQAILPRPVTRAVPPR